MPSTDSPKASGSAIARAKPDSSQSSSPTAARSSDSSVTGTLLTRVGRAGVDVEVAVHGRADAAAALADGRRPARTPGLLEVRRGLCGQRGQVLRGGRRRRGDVHAGLAPRDVPALVAAQPSVRMEHGHLRPELVADAQEEAPPCVGLLPRLRSHTTTVATRGTSSTQADASSSVERTGPVTQEKFSRASAPRVVTSRRRRSASSTWCRDRVRTNRDRSSACIDACSRRRSLRRERRDFPTPLDDSSQCRRNQLVRSSWKTLRSIRRTRAARRRRERPAQHRRRTMPSECNDALLRVRTALRRPEKYDDSCGVVIVTDASFS